MPKRQRDSFRRETRLQTKSRTELLVYIQDGMKNIPNFLDDLCQIIHDFAFVMDCGFKKFVESQCFVVPFNMIQSPCFLDHLAHEVMLLDAEKWDSVSRAWMNVRQELETNVKGTCGDPIAVLFHSLVLFSKKQDYLLAEALERDLTNVLISGLCCLALHPQLMKFIEKALAVLIPRYNRKQYAFIPWVDILLHEYHPNTIIFRLSSSLSWFIDDYTREKHAELCVGIRTKVLDFFRRHPIPFSLFNVSQKRPRFYD